jgi:hypothetical protein
LSYWKNLCLRYAKQLKEKSDVASSVHYLLAAGDAQQAIELQASNGDTEDALLTAASESARALPLPVYDDGTPALFVCAFPVCCAR